MASPSIGVSECPSCHRIDSVQKVSAIVSAGTTTAKYESSWGNNTVTGGSTITLAGHLALPPKPDKATGLALFVLQVPIIFLILVGPCALVSQGTLSGWVIIGFLLALIASLGAFLGGPNKREESLAKIAEWERAKDRWDTACYCHRCDAVYLRNGTEFMSVRRFHEMLGLEKPLS